jgi:hypothetical protein
LLFAAGNGCTETVHALLQHPSINVNQADVSLYLPHPVLCSSWGVGWGWFTTTSPSFFLLLKCLITSYTSKIDHLPWKMWLSSIFYFSWWCSSYPLVW